MNKAFEKRIATMQANHSQQQQQQQQQQQNARPSKAQTIDIDELKQQLVNQQAQQQQQVNNLLKTQAQQQEEFEVSERIERALMKTRTMKCAKLI